ncbi:DUF1996 domain-containing protein [Streptomyces sp. ODS05-4]|uniref:DUF1996 domain-containing protein n=1 Tax=Streptomyces sp. ODS05-4 TaxID=2944939 RepID=UPI00210E7810|nr:DUF1996 domain-containing protein [Streptomyces sp. ODS05-4]
MHGRERTPRRVSGGRRLSALLVGTALAASLIGVGSIASAADPAANSATSATGTVSAHSAHAGHAAHAGRAAAAVATPDDPDGDGYIPAPSPVTGVPPSHRTPPPRYFHEFQANCSVSHTAPDDPIVYPGRPGASHDHTFMGNTSTNGDSVTGTLYGGATRCKAPGDSSAYWMPSLFRGQQKILPVGDQVIYYKSGVTDYTSVRPFPRGLRFVVGSPTQSAQQFRDHPGWVEGWECGDSYRNTAFPAQCPGGTQLNIRMQAPSCWDGRYLDTPDHQSHMAYPVVKPGGNDDVCPASHPVALPMVEFKMAFPVDGDMSQVRLASGAAHSFHYDFFNAWQEPVLKRLVEHCVVGGLQCDARGYDETHPEAGVALTADYRLP